MKNIPKNRWTKESAMKTKDMTGERSFVVFKTAFGEMSILWGILRKQVTVYRLFLPRQGAIMEELVQEMAPGVSMESCTQIEKCREIIQRSLSGEEICFDLDLLHFEQCSLFQRRVLLAEAQIPRGWVGTYGGISEYLGVPGGSRAVGSALARNPFPIFIPCHRAVRSDGSIGGYQGGRGMKSALLTMEGVSVTAQGKIKCLKDHLHHYPAVTEPDNRGFFSPK
jgi:methylated-DNA-[protein]-cysteine S-methyltransferase